MKKTFVKIRVKKTGEEFTGEVSYCAPSIFALTTRGKERISEKEYEDRGWGKSYEEHGFKWWYHDLGEYESQRCFNGYYVQTPKWVKLFSPDSVEEIGDRRSIELM